PGRRGEHADRPPGIPGERLGHHIAAAPGNGADLHDEVDEGLAGVDHPGHEGDLKARARDRTDRSAVEFLPMIVLVSACVGLTAIARHRGWPAPLLVTGVSLAVAGLPWIPEFEIDSHVILTLVLPPLLYSAALDISLLNFARSRRHISRLGVVLVVV